MKYKAQPLFLLRVRELKSMSSISPKNALRSKLETILSHSAEAALLQGK